MQEESLLNYGKKKWNHILQQTRKHPQKKNKLMKFIDLIINSSSMPWCDLNEIYIYSYFNGQVMYMINI
jgi:hypothetical protein